MIISENFFKDIPINKKEIILRKLITFENSIKECCTINDIQKGFWIRKIKGTSILKFRINSGDRILFYIDNKEKESRVVFLRYCNHDEQIRVAKEYDRNISNDNITEFDLDCREYIEDKVDEEIEGTLKNFISQNNAPNLERISSLIVEDEYIALLLDENNEDFLYYLSEDQFKCIKIFEKPIILSGCAGSGKSMVAIRKLLLSDTIKERQGYFSYNPLLVNKSKEYYNKFREEEQNTEFYSINDFCLKYLHLERENLILFNDFEKWVYCNKHIRALMKGYSVEQIWSEIFGIIKGYRGAQWERKTQKMLTRDEYIEIKYSYIDISNRPNIYIISELYQKWLDKESLYDENDIAFNCINKFLNEQKYEFEFLVIDEIQDMSETQILLCYLMVKHPQNIMITGDMNQTVRPNFFNFNHIKDLLYAITNTEVEETYLVKNYRNVSGIVNMLNELTAMRKRFIGNSKYDQTETYIREGNKPIVTPCSDENIRELVDRVDNTDYSIIVVGDEHTKKHLEKLGCPIGRIFTVEEIKGLEYQNVICYNMVSCMANEWENIVSGNAYGNEYYRIFFNKLYVACTRARDTLCMIENENANILFDKLKEYCNCLDDFSIEVLEFAKVSTANDWLQEAKKLEIAERYQQAINAYEKAKCSDEAERCRQLLYLREKKSYNYQKSFAIRIDSEDKRSLNGNIINMVLNKICKQFKVYLDNYAEIIISYNREDLGTKFVDFLTHDVDDINHKIAMFIEKTYKSEKRVNQRKVTIHLCLKVNADMHVHEYFETDHFDTIIVSYKNSDIYIITRNTQSGQQKELKKFYSKMEYLEEVGLNLEEALSNEDFINGMHILSTYTKDNKLEQVITKTEAIISKGRMPNQLCAKLYEAISQCCFNNIENLDERYAKTLEYAQKAIKINPEDFDAYNTAGVALLNMGKPEEAQNYFEKSLSLNKNNMLASSNLELAKKSTEEKKAKGFAKKALTDNELEKMFMELYALYDSGKYDETILYLYDIMDYYFIDNTLESGLCTMISRCYTDMEDIDNAQKYISLALEKDPDNKEAKAFHDL